MQGSEAPFTTTMQLPGLGYPVAEVTTDAYGATVPVGRTAGWGPATPPGERFGSGLSRSYLSLRPAANDAASPSTTTYTFDPAVPTGWGFVVGDIDADQVSVAATRADGSDATTAQLGFEGAFNACATTPRPGACTGAALTDVPTWDAGTATVRGNAAADDSTGADAWFVPTVPLRTLTLTYRWRSGQPTFQTWFASRTRTASGQVVVADGGDCDLTTATVSLLAADDSVLATTTPAVDGSWSFPRVATTDELQCPAHRGAGRLPRHRRRRQRPGPHHRRRRRHGLHAGPGAGSEPVGHPDLRPDGHGDRDGRPVGDHLREPERQCLGQPQREPQPQPQQQRHGARHDGGRADQHHRDHAPAGHRGARSRAAGGRPGAAARRVRGPRARASPPRLTRAGRAQRSR